MERSDRELGDGGVEVDEGLGRHAGAAPATLLPDRRDGESGQGSVLHVRGRLDALHRHTSYGRPPLDCGPNHNPKLTRTPHGRVEGHAGRCSLRKLRSEVPRSGGAPRRRTPGRAARAGADRAAAHGGAAPRAAPTPGAGPRSARHPRRRARGARRPPAAGAPRAGGDVGRRGAGGGRPGPTVLLRGDMDALPLHEDTGLEFASEIAGAMHACGHDTHVAMLASAARVLADHRDEIAGRVLLMFQPGEEGYHGARYMIEEGLLDEHGASGRRVRAAHLLDRAHRRAADPGRAGDGGRRRATRHGDRAGRPRVGPARRARPGARGRGRWSARCRWCSRGGSTRTTPPC